MSEEFKTKSETIFKKINDFILTQFENSLISETTECVKEMLNSYSVCKIYLKTLPRCDKRHYLYTVIKDNDYKKLDLLLKNGLTILPYGNKTESNLTEAAYKLALTNGCLKVLIDNGLYINNEFVVYTFNNKLIIDLYDNLYDKMQNNPIPFSTSVEINNYNNYLKFRTMSEEDEIIDQINDLSKKLLTHTVAITKKICKCSENLCTCKIKCPF